MINRTSKTFLLSELILPPPFFLFAYIYIVLLHRIEFRGHPVQKKEEQGRVVLKRERVHQNSGAVTRHPITFESRTLPLTFLIIHPVGGKVSLRGRSVEKFKAGRPRPRPRLTKIARRVELSSLTCQ